MIRALWASLRSRLTFWLLARAAHHATQGCHLAQLADEASAAAETIQVVRRPIDHLGLAVHFSAEALREGARAQAWFNLAKLAAGATEDQAEDKRRPPRRRRGRPREAWPGPARHVPTLH